MVAGQLKGPRMNPGPALTVPRKWSASMISIVCGSSIAAENSIGVRKNFQTPFFGAFTVKVPSKCTAAFPPARLPGAFLLEDLPDLPRGDRDVDVRHAQMGQGVHDGVRDGRRRTDRRRFPDSLRAERMMRRRRRRLRGLPLRRLDRGGEQVVHERPACDVPVVIVVDLL